MNTLEIMDQMLSSNSKRRSLNAPLPTAVADLAALNYLLQAWYSLVPSTYWRLHRGQAPKKGGGGIIWWSW